jgi:predicted transcriptional regulator with HTH domain
MSNEQNIDQIPEDNKPDSPKEIIIPLTEIPAIAAIEQPITVNPKPETETMEVHHHPQVEKKNFKEYVLEGLMIFLAVTMGFIAENLREYLSDNSKEKEYIVNIKSDLRSDTVNLNIWLPAMQNNIAGFDSLINLLQLSDTTKGNDLYYFTRLATRTRLFESNDNTILELKSSGNFRLIHNKALLNGFINIEKMKSRYFKLNDGATHESELMYPLIGILFDASVFQNMVLAPMKNEAPTERDFAENSKRFLQRPSNNPQLRKFDKDLINQLIYYLHQRRSTFDGEIRVLNGIKKIETGLINTINKEYNFEKE